MCMTVAPVEVVSSPCWVREAGWQLEVEPFGARWRACVLWLSWGGGVRCSAAAGVSATVSASSGRGAGGDLWRASGDGGGFWAAGGAACSGVAGNSRFRGGGRSTGRDASSAAVIRDARVAMLKMLDASRSRHNRTSTGTPVLQVGDLRRRQRALLAPERCQEPFPAGCRAGTPASASMTPSRATVLSSRTS